MRAGRCDTYIAQIPVPVPMSRILCVLVSQYAHAIVERDVSATNLRAWSDRCKIQVVVEQLKHVMVSMTMSAEREAEDRQHRTYAMSKASTKSSSTGPLDSDEIKPRLMNWCLCPNSTRKSLDVPVLGRFGRLIWSSPDITIVEDARSQRLYRSAQTTRVRHVVQSRITRTKTHLVASPTEPSSLASPTMLGSYMNH